MHIFHLNREALNELMIIYINIYIYNVSYMDNNYKIDDQAISWVHK